MPNLVGYSFVSTEDAASPTDVYALSEYEYNSPEHLTPGESVGWRAVRPLPYSADTQRLIMIRDAGWGEYDNSSTYNRSNYRVLTENYGQWLVTVDNGNDRDGRGLALVVGSVVPNELMQIVIGLQDYPIIDESDLSELESELATEAWDGWARQDFSSDVRAAVRESAEDSEHADRAEDALDAVEDSELARVFWQSMEELGSYPEAEGSCSVRFPYWSCMVDGYAEQILARTAAGYVAPVAQCAGQAELGL